MGRDADLALLKRQLAAACAIYRQAKRPRTDAVKRRAAVQSLAAVIAFIKADPNWRGLDEMLCRLAVALADINRGCLPASWLSNPPPNRPPPRLGIEQRRGEAAAHMEWLMKDLGLEAAAKKVFRRIKSSSSLFHGTRTPTWRTVKRWRDNLGAPNSVRRKAFEEVLARRAR